MTGGEAAASVLRRRNCLLLFQYDLAPIGKRNLHADVALVVLALAAIDLPGGTLLLLLQSAADCALFRRFERLTALSAGATNRVAQNQHDDGERQHQCR